MTKPATSESDVPREYMGGVITSPADAAAVASNPPTAVLTGVNVKTDFGAKGNGVADDTAAITAALASIPSSGGTLFFPAGTYMVQASGAFTGAFDINTAKIRMLGSGPSSILKLLPTSANGSRIVRVFADDFECCDLQFDPNAIGQGTGIYLTASSRAKIHHNLFTNPVSGGVHVATGTFDLIVRDNHFQGSGYGILTDDVVTGGRWMISNNSFNGGATGDAIELNVPTVGVVDVVISQNRISNYTQVSATAGFGIGVSGVSQCTITGNVIRNCGRNGIHVDPASNAAGITISGNVVTATGQAGIEVQSEATGGANGQPTDVTITGNIVYGCCTNPLYNLGRGGIDCGSSTSGASVGFGVHGLAIAGNVVTGTLNSKAGIYVIGDGSTSTPGTISGNLCRLNGGNGILVYNGLDMVVSGNRCRDNTLYGMRIDGSAIGLMVHGNTFTGNTAGTLTDASAGSDIIRSNYGVNPIGNRFAPAFPATTVAYTNNTGYDVTAFITNGVGVLTLVIDVTVTSSNPITVTVPASVLASIRIPASCKVTPTYASGAPTWVFLGD